MTSVVMPLFASLYKPGSAPDFSSVALAELHAECIEFGEHVRLYIEAASIDQLKILIDDVTRIRDTLIILQRPGAVMVADEVLALLDAMAVGAVDSVDDCAHAIVLASEQLRDYVAYLQKPRSVDCVLPLLPVLNNCRACRGESLLSESLVLAAGIRLPSDPILPPPDDLDLTTFVHRVQSSRKLLMQGLLDWYRGKSELPQALAEVARLLSELADACDTPTSLRALVPLFNSAHVVSDALHNGQLDESAALKRLFAQLERFVQRCGRLTASDAQVLDQLLPQGLFRNFLYYVALSHSQHSLATELRNQYQLHRFVLKDSDSDQTRHALDGVGQRLSDSIRDSIDAETEILRNWLAQAATDQKHPQVVRLRARLSQLEPALSLLGAHQALEFLQQINLSLDRLADPSIDVHAERLVVAETLIRLDRALHEPGTGEFYSANSRYGTPQTLLDDAIAACIAESRRRLQKVEFDLVTLFEAREPGSTDAMASVLSKPLLDVTQQLGLIEQALSVLPAAECQQLIHDIGGALTSYSIGEQTPQMHQALAAALVTLDYALCCGAQPDNRTDKPILDAVIDTATVTNTNTNTNTIHLNTDIEPGAGLMRTTGRTQVVEPASTSVASSKKCLFGWANG